MKDFRTDKETGMMVFYVMLEKANEKKPQASTFNSARGNLKLVVNR